MMTLMQRKYAQEDLGREHRLEDHEQKVTWIDGEQASPSYQMTNVMLAVLSSSLYSGRWPH